MIVIGTETVERYSATQQGARRIRALRRPSLTQADDLVPWRPRQRGWLLVSRIHFTIHVPCSLIARCIASGARSRSPGQVTAPKTILAWPGDLDLAPDAMHRAIKEHGTWIVK